MANGQMGVSCLEKNGSLVCNYGQKPCLPSGFLFSSRPFSISVRVSGYRKFSASLSKDAKIDSGGGVLEKELVFKPSFDEYLKVMESVKTKREKRKDKTLVERDEDSVKIKTFRGKEKALQVMKQDRFEKSGRVVDREGLVGDNFGENEMRSEEIKGGSSKMGFRDGFSKDRANNEISFRDRVDVEEREINTKLRNDVGSKTNYQRWSKYQNSDVNEELEDSEYDNRAKIQRSRWSRQEPVTHDNINSSTRRRRGLQHDVNSSGMFESKGSLDNKSDFSMLNWGRVNSEMHTRHEKDHVRSERFTHRKSGENEKFSRKNTKLENGDHKSLEIERAAFKTLDVSNVMDKPRVTRMEMEERIQKLAKSLNGADIDMPEWMFSQMMRSAKIRFSDHSILRVIQILGNLGNWRRVLQVIEWLQVRERFKSHKLRFIYTTALNALGKARRPVEALNVFHVMQQQMLSYPDMVAYHSIAVTLGQAGHMKELFDVIDCMRSPPKKKFKTGVLEKWDPRLEPDLVIYNAVLNACVKRKHWEGAFWVLQQLEQQSQQPSNTTYGLVMEVMLECGKYNLVHEFFRKVQKSSIPNALTYKVLVNTLWREGRADEAVSAVKEMERRGIVGSAALYYDLARCLCSAGRCQEALMQIKKICWVANKPLVVTYTGLIQVCLDSGNIQDGAYIFRQMHGFCSPNLVTYNILLKAYLEHGMFEEAKELFCKMSDDGNNIRSKSDYRDRVIPDTYTFNTILDACIAERRWNDFEYFYKEMLQHGYHFNAKRHLRMILDASRAGKVEVVETTLKHLAQADRTPPLPLVIERFCTKLEVNDFSSAISCITALPNSELQAISKVVWRKMFKDNAQRFREDSLDGLFREVTNLIGRGDSWNLVFQDLLISYRDFLRIRKNCTGSTILESI